MRLFVWGTAVVAYVLAVVGRSALAATGVTAAQRFDVSAATLSLLAVLSLAGYRAPPVPPRLAVRRQRAPRGYPRRAPASCGGRPPPGPPASRWGSPRRCRPPPGASWPESESTASS